MALCCCCCRRNGVVWFAAFFTMVGVLVIAAGRLWLSWAVVAESAVLPDASAKPFRDSHIDVMIFHLLQLRAQRLSADERESLAASPDLHETKVIAISFIVLGAVKTSLSALLLLAGLMELERVLRWYLLGNALLLAAAALQAVAVEVVVLQERPGAVFAMPGDLSSRVAATTLPLTVIFFCGVDVVAMVCVRRFYCDLRAQRHRPNMAVPI